MSRVKRVAMFGIGDHSSIELDGDFEFWGVNNCYLSDFANIGRYTAWFELHRIEYTDRYLRRDSELMGSMSVDDHIERLNDLGIPVYMQRKIKDVIRSRPFPLLDVLNRFPRGYFTNSFALMIAFAIIRNFNEIHIYGVCRANEDIREYLVHRFSTEYMLGVAEGLGIKVFIPEYSELLRGKYIYAYQENPYSYEQYKNTLNSVTLPKYYIQEGFGWGHI